MEFENFSDIMNYIKNNNQDSILSIMFDEEKIKEVERVKSYISFTNEMHDIFFKTNSIPHVKHNKNNIYSEDELLKKVYALKLLYSEYKVGLNEDIFLNSIFEDNIADAYSYMNTYLSTKGYDIIQEFISNATLAMISDNTGLGISEIVYFSETVDVYKYPYLLNSTLIFDRINVAKEEFVNEENKDEYNESSNNALLDAYHDMVDIICNHLKNKEEFKRTK